MQQDGNVNVEERFGRTVEEVSHLLEEHGRWCAEQVAAAEEAVQGDIGRFEELSEQLAQGRRRLAKLEEEKSRLPFEAYKANMDGDGQRESELKERYEAIKPEDLEALRRSCGELEAGMQSLGGTAHDAEKRAYGNALDAHASVLDSLERFEDRIARLIEDVGEARAPFSNGKRRIDEHLQFLREIGQNERREARREAARREEEARSAAAGGGRRR